MSEDLGKRRKKFIPNLLHVIVLTAICLTLVVSLFAGILSGGIHLPGAAITNYTGPSLRLPWQSGSYSIIQSYNCGLDWDHHGKDEFAIDFPMNIGTPITAVFSGILSQGDGYGLAAIVTNGNWRAVYGHMSSVDATLVGRFVKQGTVIGKSGNTSGNGSISTGPHLHFSLRSGGSDAYNGDPVRPEPMSGYGIGGDGVSFGEYGDCGNRQGSFNPVHFAPGGWWNTPPTPQDGTYVTAGGKLNVSVHAHDYTGSGLDHVNITWLDTGTSNNQTWSKQTRTFSSGIKDNDFSYNIPIPFTNLTSEVLVSFDVYAKNGQSQLAPNGVHRYCLSAKTTCTPYTIGDGKGGGGNGVIVCSDTNYNGTCSSFNVGQQIPDLGLYGLNGNISSLQVPSNMTLVLYDQKNLSGQHGTFNQDVADLSTNGNWNDRAKSLKIEKKLDVSCTVGNNVNGIILYHDVNYGTNGGCRLATDSINDLGTMNFTRISSIRFSGTFVNHKKVTLYKDANYGLVCGTYTTDKSDLRDCAQQDIVSLKIEDYIQPQQANNIASSAILDPSNAGNAVDSDVNTEWKGSNKQPLTLTFPSTQSIQKIVLYDRFQNHPDNSQINKVQIDFSDGTKTPEVDMESGGRRCAAISFSVKAAKKVIVQPTDASGNNGFREVFIYDNSASGTDNPCDNATNVTLLGTPVVQPEQNQPQPVQSGENPPNNNPSTQPTPTPTAIPTENATNYHPTQTEDVEAESQERTGPAYIEHCGGCSGGKFVFNVGSDGNGGQTLGTVKVSIAMKYAGDYQLTIYYCSAQDMDGQIDVANGTSYPIHYPSAGTVCWNGGSPAHISTTIHLNGQGDLITFSIPNPPTSGEARFGIDKMVFVG